jgi:hypothetical protein
VLEYIPETVHSVAKMFSRAKEPMPMLSIKTYMYQLLRALAHIHGMGICHRSSLFPLSLALSFSISHRLLSSLVTSNHRTCSLIQVDKFLNYVILVQRRLWSKASQMWLTSAPGDLSPPPTPAARHHCLPDITELLNSSLDQRNTPQLLMFGPLDASSQSC